MADKNFDVVVIGSGPGGYVCAIRAAQLGFKVACIEKRKTLGGTCLNVGCIPSKALLQASEKFSEAGHLHASLGINNGGVSLDLAKMQGFKDGVVKANTDGVAYLFKKNKVEWLQGTASFKDSTTLIVAGESGEQTVSARHIIIATGSDVVSLPGIAIDEQRIVSSTGALTLGAVPKKMIVIGGGYIGLEMGAVWQRLGAEVTVVEFLDRILPGMDGEVSKQMQRILAKQGMNFKLSTKVTSAKPILNVNASGVAVTLEPAAGGAPESMEVDIVLVAVGRKPYTQGLNLEAAGVKLDERGRIVSDAHFKTTAPNIYAIGDVREGPMLAHKAEDEGSILAEMLAGQAGHIDYNLVPGVVYTWPEAAAIGQTEEQLKQARVAYKVGKFPFSANGRARAMSMTEGFVKILADDKTDRILGAHIIGPEAGTLIHEIATAMEFGASAEDIARTCHAHPTLNEAVKEAALAVEGRPIHI
jgi:dihydrolipoamide dehydrogenase